MSVAIFEERFGKLWKGDKGRWRRRVRRVLTGGADAVTWSKMTDAEANAITYLAVARESI